MKQKPARRGSRINRTRAAENAEIAAALTKLFDKVQQCDHPAAESIKPPDHETIASPQMRQGLGKTRAIITDPRCFVLKDALAASVSEGIALQIEVLIFGRDARITNQHVSGLGALKTCWRVGDRT